MSEDLKKEQYKKVILPLYLLMQLSVKAYKKYMQNKIYLHALVIRSSNQKVYDHILTHLASVPEELQDEVLQLLNHYDIWMNQFNEFEKTRQPSLSDSFVFYHLDEQSSFPRQAEERIFSYYQSLKKSIK